MIFNQMIKRRGDAVRPLVNVQQPYINKRLRPTRKERLKP